VSRVDGPVDRYFDRSTVDSRPGQGGALTGAWRAATMEGRSLPRKHLEKEGTEGNPTAVLVGARRCGLAGRRWTEAAEEVSRWGSRLEHGEWELGAGLDAVERWGALGRFI
jgi:hypothetical protein